MIKKKLLNKLACPKCLKGLNLNEGKLICYCCQKEYLITNDKPYLLEKQGRGFRETSSDVILNKLKVFFKKYPLIFNFFFYAFGASLVGKSPQKAISDIGSDKTILNLGSGVKKIREDIINVDFYPFSNVDIVANLYHLPFRNNSVDAVINEFVLEHIKDPQAVIKEMSRVLKPGGLIYIAIPFLISFHSSPNDYYRWTKSGLRELMRNFREEEFGVRSGPTSALMSVLVSWLATVFSFGSKKLYQIWAMVLMIITCPFKFLDFLIYKLPNADDSSLGFYFIGRK